MNIRITKKQKTGIVVFLFIVLTITSIIYFKNKTELPKDELKSNRVLVEDTKEAGSLLSSKDPASKDAASKEIKAYICGYVVTPGVYLLKEGDRLDDLVKLSGGFTKEADTEGINLAHLIKDQEYFRIPSKGEVKENKISPTEASNIGMKNNTNEKTNKEGEVGGKININTSTKEELKELPRIGDSLSQRIIDYREEKGGFKSIEDIKEVSGIGEKMFENIKDKITVE